ncbi:MAG: diphosphate--fructose-6-phosphate 1-phosphotransferase [Spirochaetia bacterium]
MNLSSLQKLRSSYVPKLPKILKLHFSQVTPVKGENTESIADQSQIQQIFPLTYGLPKITFDSDENAPEQASSALNIGILLSGGQAPGGHNVIAGLFDTMKKANEKSVLYGFLGGPQGLIDTNYKEITKDLIEQYRNTGGFDIIQSGRTKLEGREVFEKATATCQKLKLNALIIVGGDDSNTNAALLGEYFLSQNVKTQIIGCPKTIDGDLKNDLIEVSFGFDTACRTYSELIGNIARDACSAQKYWHFIRLMGRSASHITLECALQTQPNIAIISEEVAEKKMTMQMIVQTIIDSIIARAKKGLNFGIVLIPEGLIEFIPEFNTLISNLNLLLADPTQEFVQAKTASEKVQWISDHLPQHSQATYTLLPMGIREQLIMDRDPHGNIQVSAIETEKLLIELVADQLKKMQDKGQYKGKFSSLGHFFGYEGRAAFPTNFDADYCYSLGSTAFLLAAHGYTGYMSCVHYLNQNFEKWAPAGVPLIMMMNLEERHGKRKPVIRKALVELKGKPFQTFSKHRQEWAEHNHYLFPGPIQYYGPTEVCDQPPRSLKLERD